MPNLNNQILEMVEAAGRRGMTLAEVKKNLDAPPGKVTGLFKGLIGKGQLVEMPGGRFRRAEPLRRKAGRTPDGVRVRRTRGKGRAAKANPTGTVDPASFPKDAVVGTLSVHRDGYGFVTPTDGKLDMDLFIPPGQLGGAMGGDVVGVSPTKESDGRYKGSILGVVERARTHVSGYLERASSKLWVLMPTNPEKGTAMEIAHGDHGDAEEGDVVLAKVTDFGDGSGPLRGAVTEVLGKAGDPAVDAQMIIAEHAIRATWPDEVLKAAERVPTEIDPAEIGDRLDLRDQPCFTIDGADARDLDDAVFVEPGPRGTTRLWVHIADVSHYVRPGDAIDREAIERGTSTYLPDRVIPMLPVALSNGICSLNPDVDRLALTCRIDFDKGGKPRFAKVMSTVIRSHARLTYKQVQAACVDRDPKTRKELGPLLENLDLAWELSQTLRAERRRQGALDFDIGSVKIVTDETGTPVDVVPLGAPEAHGLIEMFMVAANEAVSRWMVEGKKTFVFRIHETPDPQKLAGLAELARDLGFDPGKIVGKDPRPGLASLLEQVDGKPEETMLRTLTLRCMKLAEYNAENRGHFGLGSRAYTHFTSPIRRYPDLIVHRLLKDRTGDLRLSRRDRKRIHDGLPDTLKKLSTLERKAEEAERDALRLKKTHYLSSRIGETFPGVISGVKEFGLFVEITQLMADGLIHVSKLGGDYWKYDEAGRKMVGATSKVELRLGDPIDVVVTSADPRERKVMLQPAQDLAGIDMSKLRLKKARKSEAARQEPEEPRKRSRRGRGRGSSRNAERKRELAQARKERKKSTTSSGTASSRGKSATKKPAPSPKGTSTRKPAPTRKKTGAKKSASPGGGSPAKKKSPRRTPARKKKSGGKPRGR